MTANESLSPVSQFNSKNIFRMSAAAIMGAAIGYGTITSLLKLHIPVKQLGWSDLLALAVGMAFLVIGLMMMAYTVNRKQLAELLESEDKTTPATDDEARSFRMQGITLILAGVMLLTPILALGTLRSNATASLLLFCAVVVLFVLQTATNVRIWKTCDEFGRGVMLRNGAITFAIGQGALFLWATAEHLQLVRAATSWQTINLLLALYLVVSTTTSLRYTR